VRQSLAAEEDAEKLANLQAKWEQWQRAADLQATSQAQWRAERKLREHRRKEEQVRKLESCICNSVIATNYIFTSCFWGKVGPLMGLML